MEANYRICHECEGKMIPKTISKIFRFHGKEIEIKGISAYVCEDCGEIIYSDKEFEMIENLMYSLTENNSLNVDVLNLEETAKYLRVSNQTVYNMIRDGRIKAHKVGREWRFLKADIKSFICPSFSEDAMSLAAKGGIATKSDIDVIKAALQKMDKGNIDG